MGPTKSWCFTCVTHCCWSHVLHSCCLVTGQLVNRNFKQTQFLFFCNHQRQVSMCSLTPNCDLCLNLTIWFYCPRDHWVNAKLTTVHLSTTPPKRKLMPVQWKFKESKRRSLFMTFYFLHIASNKLIKTKLVTKQLHQRDDNDLRWKTPSVGKIHWIWLSVKTGLLV